MIAVIEVSGLGVIGNATILVAIGNVITLVGTSNTSVWLALVTLNNQ